MTLLPTWTREVRAEKREPLAMPEKLPGGNQYPFLSLRRIPEKRTTKLI